MLSELSRQLSGKLNEIIRTLPAITLNSKQMVNHLGRVHLPPDCWLLTYDVEQCYPSIDTKDAIELLSRNFPNVFATNGRFWLKVLDLLMHQNYVTANGKIYKQEKGTATGTAVAPTFGNLYLFCKFRPVMKRFVKHVIWDRCYLDDSFVIARTREAAVSRMENLNHASNLVLKREVSCYEAIYLDFRIFKGENFRRHGIFDTGVYKKPISKFLYLHGISNHPKHTTTGIIKGEMIRYLRNTSSRRLWTFKTRFFYQKMAERYYSRSEMQEAMEYASFEERGKYLANYEPKPFQPDAFVVYQYHPQLRKASKALEKWVYVTDRHPILRRA